MVDSADGCGVRLVFSYGSAPSPSPFPFFVCCSARGLLYYVGMSAVALALGGVKMWFVGRIDTLNS
jgi:hypothetical protein